MIIVPFGERVRVIRQELQEGLRAIAEKAGISICYLSEFERNKRPFPSADALFRMGKAVGKDLSEITCAIDTDDLLHSMRYDPIKARIIWTLVYLPPSTEVVREIAQVLGGDQ
jgi:transcriptional regulator with XRE-family HTH domain